MPPKAKITQADIIKAALTIVRSKGADMLNARALATLLNCSTQPIFSNYNNMTELRNDVIRSAQEIYRSYIEKGMKDPSLPAYKGSGMAYILFAKEETELFKLLFMRDRRGENLDTNKDEIRDIIALLMQSHGFDEKSAYDFHMKMWIFVHGIATMIATNYVPWDKETISRMISEEYHSYLSYCKKQRNGGNQT